jgi:hypothetical protein
MMFNWSLAGQLTLPTAKDSRSKPAISDSSSHNVRMDFAFPLLDLAMLPSISPLRDSIQPPSSESFNLTSGDRPQRSSP